MILGYGLIAVPTGIVSVEIAKIDKKNFSTQSCPECSSEGHDSDSVHCKFCGAHL
jgi:voltage-gated potassium channel